MLGTYHLTVLYDILKDLHFLYQTDKIHVFLLENLMKALDADAASLFIAHPEKEELILKACIGPKQKMLELVAEEMPFPYGKGICGWAAKFDQPVTVDNAQADERFSSQVDTLIGYKTKSILCAPISNKGEVLGVIEVLNKKSAAFNKNDQDLVALIARQTAIALENARLYENLLSSRNFNDSVLANLTGGFVAIETEGRLTHINGAAEKILVLPPGGVGRKMTDVLKDYPALCEELSLVLKSGEPKVRNEINCERPDKTTANIGYSTFPIQDKSGKILGSALIFQDLTQMIPH